ncbi:MAG: HAMP domain-containing protein [bacterium]|nr:HAMP domain-containing protein [bacterium]
MTKKILCYMLLICLFFSLLYFVLFRLILATPIKEQKILRARKIVTDAMSVFQSETNRILTFSDDWAAWDSMYAYTSNPTKKFEADMAPRLVLKDYDFSFFAVTGRDKSILYNVGYKIKTKKYLAFKNFGEKQGRLWGYLLKTFGLKGSASGIVNSQYGPLLVVSSPVMRSDGTGPANGRMMMGRFIDRSFDKKIATAVGEPTRVVPADNLTEDHPETLKKMLPLVEETTDSIIIKHHVLDVNLKRAFYIRVTAGKYIFNILEKSTRLFFILLIAGFLLLGISFYFIIDRLVVRRIKHISTTTNNIFSFDDLSSRIPVDYKDEITSLSKNINTMLHRLQRENIKKVEIEHMLALNEKLIFMGKVSAGIAHEVNNPLFAVSNSIQLIKRYLPPENKRLNDVVDVVEREIKRVRNITRNMNTLTIREIEEPSLSDITTIMNAAIKILKWSKLLKYTQVEYKKKKRAFPLHCNPESLQQVFMNMMANAIDAMDGKGQLTIDVSEKKDYYIIDFIDSGPGIGAEIKPYLFTPFKTSKVGKGTGLGLHISNNIIVNHGGTITLNEEYRDGAHLVIRIPKKGGQSNE